MEPHNGRKHEIPLGARIVAFADSFNAMTTDRPYRKGMTQRPALEEIAASSGKQFDPMVVEAINRVLDKKLETIQGLFSGPKEKPILQREPAATAVKAPALFDLTPLFLIY